MNTLIILTLFLTISTCLSTPSHLDGGFTVDLIHRDSPLSPLYNSTHSLTDRLQNAFLRSRHRSFLFSKRLGFGSKSLEADVFGIPGEYIMKIQIGTPPVDIFGVADTGSDLTWAQCQPCRSCYKQVGPPLLDPTSSSTYQAQSCQSEACQALETDSSCNSNNTCQYKMTYGDKSYSIGDLSEDTFWFGSTSLPNVVYGCGHENKGMFNEKISGIVGLGGGRALSIINQLTSSIQGKFSYCLIPHYNDSASNQTSKIHFGDGVNVSGPSVVSTPLVQKDPSTYFYLTLENVSVGAKDLPYKQSLARTQANEEGNIIIDSGTTLTYLPRELYDGFLTSLSDAIGGDTVQDPYGFFELCYNEVNLGRVPTVTFRFAGADVVIPAENMFLEVKQGLTCLTIVASDELAIFGNLSQANILVGYDLVNQMVSFEPTDCTTMQY